VLIGSILLIVILVVQTILSFIVGFNTFIAFVPSLISEFMIFLVLLVFVIAHRWLLPDGYNKALKDMEAEDEKVINASVNET
jgi:hypothetical protein